MTDGETSRFVELCADQIKAAIDEALCEIDVLSRTFLDTARLASELLCVIGDPIPDASPVNDSVLADSRALQQTLQNAVMRLQFADRLNQRLSNVSRNLTNLAGLMQSTDLPITDTRWTGFLKETRVMFTVEPERQMFDAMFAVSEVIAGTEQATDPSRDPNLCDGDTKDGA